MGRGGNNRPANGKESDSTVGLLLNVSGEYWYCTHHIFMYIKDLSKSRRLRWAGHVVGTG